MKHLGQVTSEDAVPRLLRDDGVRRRALGRRLTVTPSICKGLRAIFTAERGQCQQERRRGVKDHAILEGNDKLFQFTDLAVVKHY